MLAVSIYLPGSLAVLQFEIHTGVAMAGSLWETVDMAKRALRVVKNLGRIPAVAVYTVCGKTFSAPLGALVSVKDAEAKLQQQFYGHKCDQKDARQTACRIMGKNALGLLRN